MGQKGAKGDSEAGQGDRPKGTDGQKRAERAKRGQRGWPRGVAAAVRQTPGP